MKNQTKAIIYAFAVVLCWGTVASAFKIALSEISYIKLLLISSFTAFLIFGIDITVKRKWNKLLVSLKDRKQLIRYAALGAMNPFLYYLVLFKAYSLLPAQVAQPLNYSWQIVLVLLSVPMLGIKIVKAQVLWLAVSFVGIILISTNGSVEGVGSGSVIGVLLALASAFIWALYWIFGNREDGKSDSSIRLFMNFAFGLLFLIIYCAVFDDFTMPSTGAIVASVYVGMFEMGITFIFWAKALSLATDKPSVIGLTYLSPVLSIILIHFVLGESIMITTVIGFLLIICGVYFSNRMTSRKQKLG